MRVEQERGTKGSLKQIQRLANRRPELVADELRARIGGTDGVTWLSPLETDGFAEYRDQSALDLLGVATPRRALSDFWPSRGPQWDGLVRMGDRPILIEAKAHIPELFSGASQARSPTSREKIRRALDETQKWLKARPGLDWMERFYQYTNRLAHLYFLRKVNGLDAHLVFLYFLGDRDMNGPRSRGEWEAAIAVLHEALGIRGRSVPGMHHLFVDVGEIEVGPRVGTAIRSVASGGDGLRFVGVDGCRSGWLSVALDGSGGWDVAVHESFPALWEAHQGADHILVDVPIGLRRDGEGERVCDKEARRLLGAPRGSSVFPAPCRAALSARDHREASSINREMTGRGLSVQSWGIAPKIREVDRILRDQPSARRRVREVHPEVLFWALNGGTAVATRKKERVGFQERYEILRRLSPVTAAVVSESLSRWRRSLVARDDILDALAAAVTAQLGSGDFETVPRVPEKDREGLPMEMVYVRPDRPEQTPAE